MAGGTPAAADQRHVRLEPGLDVALEQRPRRLVALEGSGVKGEEQAFEIREGGVGDVGPHAPDHLVGGLAGIRTDVLGDGGEDRLRTRLDGLHHRQDQTLLGAEVVEEHAVARAGGLGDASQALVGETLAAEVRDHRVEEAFPGSGRGGLDGHMYQMVHSPRSGVRRRQRWDCR